MVIGSTGTDCGSLNSNPTLYGMCFTLIGCLLGGWLLIVHLPSSTDYVKNGTDTGDARYNNKNQSCRLISDFWQQLLEQSGLGVQRQCCVGKVIANSDCCLVNIEKFEPLRYIHRHQNVHQQLWLPKFTFLPQDSLCHNCNDSLECSKSASQSICKKYKLKLMVYCVRSYHPSWAKFGSKIGRFYAIKWQFHTPNQHQCLRSERVTAESM